MKRDIPYIHFSWERLSLSVNEGYGPINFFISFRPFFYYLYFFGKRYYKK